MSTLVSDAPTSFNAITITQVTKTDREMFSILASEFKGSLKAALGARPPLDEVFEKLMHDPGTNVHLIAMPKVNALPQKRPLEDDAGKPNPGPQKPYKRIKPGEKPVPQMPEELAGLNKRTEAGKPMCWHFNMSEGCNNPVKAGRCGSECMIACNVGRHGMVQPDAKQVDRGTLQVMSLPIMKLLQASNTSSLESAKLHVNSSIHLQLIIVEFFPNSTNVNFGFPDDPSHCDGAPRKSSGLVLEVFAGSCRCSKECKELGLRVLAMSRTLRGKKNPVAAFDLTKPHGFQTVCKFVETERDSICWAHFAPSCGTA